MALLAAIAFCAPATATPIKPDIKKLVAEPQQPQTPYMPARAGWNGPEMQKVPVDAAPPAFSHAGTARAIRASLLAAIVPDWRMALALAIAIFVLRRLQRLQPA